MKRAVVLLAACSPAARPTPPKHTVIEQVAGAPEPLPFGAACVAAGDPALLELQRRADAASRASFETELARSKLRPLALAMHRDELAEGLSYTAPHAPEGTELTRKLAGAEGTFVAAETQWSGNAGSPPAWEFVQDEEGGVYRLVRQPRAGVTRVAICTCRTPQCGPYGSGCPACGSTYQTLYGPLPAGTRYKGELALAYPAYAVSLEYNEQGCPSPRRCPDPPP